jgi:YbbR domain-containing protein
MRWESVTRAATANIALKTVSVFFAVVLWFYVTAQIEGTETVKIPLEIVNVPESLIVVSDAPRHIEVTMRGARSDLLKVRLFGSARLTVDLAGAQGRHLTVPLSKGMITLPEGLKPDNVSINAPRALSIMLEERVSAALPVRAVFRGLLPRELVLVGQPAITPDRVIARGPSNAMRAVSEVRTEAIDIAGRRGKVSLETPVVRPRGIEIEPRTVLVELDVARRAERTIEGLAPTLLQVEEDLDVVCSPASADLTVEGPEELVRNLTADDVSIILSVPPGSRGTFAVEAEVILPAGIDSFRLSVKFFDVTVSAKR